MVVVLIFSEMEILFKVSTSMENQRALVNIDGAMEVFILEILRMGLNTGKENGRKATYLMQINMKESINWTRNMVMVFLVGKAVTFTKEITKKTFVMAMERCSGKMAQSTKVNGGKEFNMVKDS